MDISFLAQLFSAPQASKLVCFQSKDGFQLTLPNHLQFRSKMAEWNKDPFFRPFFIQACNSSPFTLELFCSFLLNSEFYERLTSSISVFDFSENHLKLITEKYCNKKIENALFYSLSFSGINSSIILEKSSNSELSIEKILGYRFSLMSLTHSNWNEENVAVLFIDGAIERASNIEHLLIHYSNTKQPLLLIARRFDQEVVHTIKVNNSKGTLNVCLIEIQPDLTNVNLINDLATVCLSDIVTSVYGQTLSTIQPDCLKTVPKVFIHHGLLWIINPASIGAAKATINALIEKRRSTKFEEIEKSYDKRIHSLMPNSVIVRLPNTFEYSMLRERMDLLLRWVRVCGEHGVVLCPQEDIPWGYVPAQSVWNAKALYEAYKRQKEDAIVLPL